MSDASNAVRGLERVPVLAALAARAPRGLIRFLAVGAGGLSIDLAVLALIERQGFGLAVARAVSLLLATLATWALNRRFTFDDTGRRAEAEFGRYALVALVAQGVNYLVSLAVSGAAPALPHTLAAVTGAVVATGFSYSGQRFFTFARRRGNG